MHITLLGAPIYCIEQGIPSALPIVFIHGFPFSSDMWEAQLAAVSPTCRAIAYDLRGHGRSFVGDGQFTVEGHVDDLIALLDHMKLERVVVAGLSMGGYIALRALERSPGRFIAAVLCGTRSEADGNDAKIKRANAAAAVKRTGSRAFAEEFVRSVFAPGSFQKRPETVAAIREVIAHTPPLSIAGTQLALAARTDTTPSLQYIAVPVLIMTGELDILIPPASARALHERIPGSELAVVPGAAHLSNLENPEFFNAKLLAFLARLPQAQNSV